MIKWREKYYSPFVFKLGDKNRNLWFWMALKKAKYGIKQDGILPQLMGGWVLPVDPLQNKYNAEPC